MGKTAEEREHDETDRRTAAIWEISETIEIHAKAMRDLTDAVDRLGARIENGLTKIAGALNRDPEHD